jgi:hypothetical protein
VKKLLLIISILLFSSTVFAEFRMERVICTIKKTTNCGAYIYNSLTGEVYFCDSEECKEVKTPIEVFIEEEGGGSEKGSLIPKKPKKKESKIPKKPKKESKIPKKPKKSDKCDKDSKIPKKGCN